MINHNLNIEYTNNYLILLRESLNLGWVNFYKEVIGFQSIEDLIIRKLVLLHPEHFQKLKPELDKNKILILQTKIQGKRAFENTIQRNECSSVELWGYQCPLSNEPLVWDHDFPYSFGGPSDNAYNKRLLCKWHNMVKSNDIHNYDWEALFIEYKYFCDQSRTHWIDEQLEKIKHEFNI